MIERMFDNHFTIDLSILTCFLIFSDENSDRTHKQNDRIHRQNI